MSTPADVGTSASPPGEDPSADPAATNDLRRAGAGGALWQGLAYVAGKSAVAVTTIVLARILVPEDFGIVALATVFVSYADVVSDLGVAQAIIYYRRSTSILAAAFACSFVVGALFALTAVLAAPAVGGFFGDDRVPAMVRLLAISLFAGAVASVPQAVLRRDLRFRALGGVTVVQSLTTGVVAVALALTGAGATAIVTGTVAGGVAAAVLAFVLAGSREALTFWRIGRADLRTVLGYGLPVAGGLLLTKLVADVDYLVVGRELGVHALGLYTLAFRVPELLIINVFFVVSSVTFPLYARANADAARLRRGYLASLRIQTVYGIGAGVGLAVLAPVAVPLVLGQRWSAATVPLAVLSGYAALRSLGAGANDVYKAVGRPRITLVVAGIRLAVLTTVLLVASRWGVLGVAVGQLLAAAAFVLLMQGVAVRMLSIPWSRLARTVAPALAVGLAVALVVTPLVHGLPAAGVQLPPAVTLATCMVAGAGAATLALHWCAPGFLRENVALLHRKNSGVTA